MQSTSVQLGHRANFAGLGWGSPAFFSSLLEARFISASGCGMVAAPHFTTRYRVIQPAVKSLIALGKLPSSADATKEDLERFQISIDKIMRPVSDHDARALAMLFGPDDCFGLAWMLVHLIETAPNWPPQAALYAPENQWIQLLVTDGVTPRKNDGDIRR